MKKGKNIESWSCSTVAGSVSPLAIARYPFAAHPSIHTPNKNRTSPISTPDPSLSYKIFFHSLVRDLLPCLLPYYPIALSTHYAPPYEPNPLAHLPMPPRSTRTETNDHDRQRSVKVEGQDKGGNIYIRADGAGQ